MTVLDNHFEREAMLSLKHVDEVSKIIAPERSSCRHYGSITCYVTGRAFMCVAMEIFENHQAFVSIFFYDHSLFLSTINKRKYFIDFILKFWVWVQVQVYSKTIRYQNIFVNPYGCVKDVPAKNILCFSESSQTKYSYFHNVCSNVYNIDVLESYKHRVFDGKPHVKYNLQTYSGHWVRLEISTFLFSFSFVTFSFHWIVFSFIPIKAFGCYNQQNSFISTFSFLFFSSTRKTFYLW